MFSSNQNERIENIIAELNLLQGNVSAPTKVSVPVEGAILLAGMAILVDVFGSVPFALISLRRSNDEDMACRPWNGTKDTTLRWGKLLLRSSQRKRSVFSVRL